MADVVTKKTVVNSTNFPDMHKETGEPTPEKAENRIDADKGTPNDIVPAENRIKAKPKNRPDFTEEAETK